MRKSRVQPRFRDYSSSGATLASAFFTPPSTSPLLYHSARHLTSHPGVVSLRTTPVLHDPRDTLDQLVLGWEKDNRALLENSLGPEATAALNALLEGGSWDLMRSRLWHVRKSDEAAVGYRFDAPAPWSEPAVTLALPNPTITLTLQHAANREIDTSFKDVSGKDCGTFRLRLLDPQPTTGSSYLINNSDLGTLLELISRCAANQCDVDYP